MNLHISDIIKLIFVMSAFFSINANAQYEEDILGDGYLSRTIEQPDDYDGKVVCTVIKKPTMPNVKKAIVYVHGYNDYFFQKALGDSANAHGYNFYAVDLRKYGRSLLPNQEHFFCKKMSEYFPDIDAAVSIARQEGNEKVYLMGHSTGGLSSTLYVGQKKNTPNIDGLILNSPFFDWNFGPMMENVLMPCVSFVGIFAKRLKVQGSNNVPSGYAQCLMKNFRGEWNYNGEWKKPYEHTKRAGWVHSINRGQIKARRHTDIKCPILLMSSDKSVKEEDDWREEFMYADVVLDTKEIQKYGKKIGKNVTPVIIKDGMHDLILSKKNVRDEAYKTIFEWLEKVEK